MNKNRKLGFSLVEISVVVLIIGILIAAINSGIDLVNRSKVASAQNLSTNTAIYGMKDLVLWFEPSLPSSFDDESESEPLNLWTNNSPFYNIGSAVQDDDAQAPTYVTDSINNVPAARFQGNTYLEISKVSRLLEESDLTIFILENPNDNPQGKIISAVNFEISYNNESEILVKNVDGTDTTSNGTSSTFATNPGPNLHFITLYDSDDGDFQINTETIVKDGFHYYNNKKLPQSGSMPIADIPIRNGENSARFATGNMGDTITIGDNAESYDGNISEIIIFNRKLRKDELLDIFSYLESKYNLSLSSN